MLADTWLYRARPVRHYPKPVQRLRQRQLGYPASAENGQNQVKGNEMKPTFLHAFWTGLCLSLLAQPLSAQPDMPGSRDHPEIPRIKDTVIVGYAYSDFDEGQLIENYVNKNLRIARPTGKRTRLMYLAPETLSGLQIEKNYYAALSALGTPDRVYGCVGGSCKSNLGSSFIWAAENRIPTRFNDSMFFYATFGYRDQRYAYFTVSTEHTRYHLSVYTAYLTGIQANSVKGKRAIHVDIIEEADFKASLQVVTPDEITQGIAQQGRIALYGIYFDVDSDELKPHSTPTLKAIAQALTVDPDLQLYIVGHTDNQGQYEYNVSLSRQRALAVFTALVLNHGIAASRLKPVGVGPVAPVESNGTEHGRELNRRVELVAF